MRTITLNKVDYRQYDENETGEVVETTVPCVVQVEAIRCFYQRREGRAGTRITFTDGGGFAVSDTPEEVTAAITAALAEPRRSTARH